MAGSTILKASNPTYRLIIALARYAGLRCPSELVGLRWSHILWDKDRMIIHSPKTEHCGKAKRTIPIFPELRRYLLGAQELAPEKEDRIFPDIHEDTNLRTETRRILARAGITEDIPRFYQNCRSSRQTELEADFPLHVVCKWLGNSESTARRHYLKVQGRHFEQASAGVFPSVQKMSAEPCEASQASEEIPAKRLEKVVPPANPRRAKYTREDSNNGENASGKGDSDSRCASGCAENCRWMEIRQQILGCEDLPAATRKMMIDLGDHAGTCTFTPDGQTAR